MKFEVLVELSREADGIIPVILQNMPQMMGIDNVAFISVIPIEKTKQL
jgi:hypothetical protein